MSGLNGDYMSMAEACGEVPPRPLVFIPGEDFDPADPDEVESVGLAMENDMAERNRQLERENRELREENARLRLKRSGASDEEIADLEDCGGYKPTPYDGYDEP